MNRIWVMSAALVSVVPFGCKDEAPRLGALPAAAPAEIEPGYVDLSPSTRLRPPHVLPSCRGTAPGNARPAIEVLSSGPPGNVQIWEDGVVVFEGRGCPDGRRRGKLPPARVRAVIATLEAADFFRWPCDDDPPCRDSFLTSLTLRRGAAWNTVVDTRCSSKKTLAVQAIELVTQVVGANPCGRGS